MGYIDIEAQHFFFHFFESRNDPATDVVIFGQTVVSASPRRTARAITQNRGIPMRTFSLSTHPLVWTFQMPITAKRWYVARLVDANALHASPLDRARLKRLPKTSLLS